jgi:hypothetical protein
MKIFHKPIPMLSLFALLLVVVWACRKEKPEIGNFDICDCESPVSADFEIFEASGSNVVGTNLTLTDHILGGSWAAFHAKESDAMYRWYIGSQILTNKEVARYFSQQWEYYDIPITLVVEKEPNLKCFPYDDGYDSVTKIMKVIPRFDHEPLSRGTFRVADLGLTDSFEINIDFEYHELLQPPIYFIITNYDGAGGVCTTNDTQNQPFSLRYRLLSTSQFNYIGGCNNLTFKAYFPLPGVNTVEIEVNYRTDSSPNSFITRNYKGRRL